MTSPPAFGHPLSIWRPSVWIERGNENPRFIFTPQASPMTPIEFDILDELYFPQTPAEVAEKLSLELAQVLDVVQAMLTDGLLKPEDDLEHPGQDMATLRVVATKKGLLAHNGIRERQK